MKILKVVTLILVVLVAVGGLALLLLPSESHIERSIVINSAPEKIFPVVDGFTHFQNWSPWAKKDSLTVYEFSGGLSGVGATMKWKSDNPEVGNGTQKTIEIDINRRLKSSLEFDGMGASTAEFILVPDGSATKVTWTLDSKLSGMGKIFGPLMDGMVGPDYEKGLKNLKKYVENLSPRDAKLDSIK